MLTMTGYAGTVHHIIAVVTADNSCVYIIIIIIIIMYTQEHSSVYIYYISKVYRTGYFRSHFGFSEINTRALLN